MEKEYIIYINTGFVVDCIVCRGYLSKEDAIQDLRVKFDNYKSDFIVTEKDFIKYKRNK